MKKLAFAALSAFLVAGAAVPAAQADVIWNVSGTFDDQTSFSGTFTIDQYGQLADWDITTQANGAFSGYEYKFDNTFQHWADSKYIEFASTAYNVDFKLVFQDDLGVAEALNPIIGGEQGPSYDCVNSWSCPSIGTDGSVRFVADGSASAASPAPEPITLSLVGAGLAGIGAMRRRRKSA